MPIVCQCSGISYAGYREAANKLQTQIRIAPSFKDAVELVFRDRHPEEQVKPADILGINPHCQNCTPHIAKAIREEGLRTPEEHKDWVATYVERLKSCGRRPDAAIFANNFRMPQ